MVSRGGLAGVDAACAARGPPLQKRQYATDGVIL